MKVMYSGSEYAITEVSGVYDCGFEIKTGAKQGFCFCLLWTGYEKDRMETQASDGSSTTFWKIFTLPTL